MEVGNISSVPREPDKQYLAIPHLLYWPRWLLTMPRVKEKIRGSLSLSPRTLKNFPGHTSAKPKNWFLSLRLAGPELDLQDGMFAVSITWIPVALCPCPSAPGMGTGVGSDSHISLRRKLLGGWVTCACAHS